MTDKQRLRLAIRALKLAEGIIEYCAGDAWEREVTAKDRKTFDELFKKVMQKAKRAR